MITPDWFSSDVAVWLVQSLAHVLWQGFVLLIIAGVAEALLAKRSSQTRYALWSIALLLSAREPCRACTVAGRDGCPVTT
jgi:hypothetical protein